MKIVFFPGLGADEGLFIKQLKAFSEIIVPQWIKPNPNETLSDYCKRYVIELDIHDEDLILGGMSFGGQVALELAQIIPAKAVLLMSSHRSSEEILPRFKRQVQLSKIIPNVFIQWGLKCLSSKLFQKKENLNHEDFNVLNIMAKNNDLSFFRWASDAAAHWHFKYNAQEYPAPVFQIHGKHDWVIPCPQTDQYSNVTFLEGRHLITYTHSEEVNQWIKNVVTAVS